MNVSLQCSAFNAVSALTWDRIVTIIYVKMKGLQRSRATQYSPPSKGSVGASLSENSKVSLGAGSKAAGSPGSLRQYLSRAARRHLGSSHLQPPYQYVCFYVCMYACTSVLFSSVMYAHTHTYTYLYTHTYMFVYVCTSCICTCMHTLYRLYICICICICICTCMYMLLNALTIAYV